MFSQSYEQYLGALTRQSGLSQRDIEEKIEKKLKDLSGLISRDGALHIVANELGVKLENTLTGGILKLKDIVPGMKNLETAGKVIQVYELREFTSKDRKGKVASLLMGDETQTLRLTMWGEQAHTVEKVKPGDIIKISAGYVKDNRGQLEIYANERTVLDINPQGLSVEGVTVSQDPSALPNTRKTIKELDSENVSVELFATLVQVYEPRFFERKNTGETSYLVNGVLDDGTETMRTVFFAEQAQSLLGLAHEDIMKFKDDPTLFASKKQELVGAQLKVQGRTKLNTYFDRLEFTARSVNMNPDPKAELEALEKI